MSIAGPRVTKEVYAVDGVVGAPVEIAAGHTITYRIGFEMATADFENLVLTDFLPLPIYDATEVTGFDNSGPAAIPPAAGFFSYGPNHSLHSIAPTTDPPSLSTSAASNSLQFNFGSFDVDNSPASTIDLLFTVTAQDMRFADGLLLTNQANATYGLTNSNSTSSNAIAQNTVVAPGVGNQ